MKQKDKRITMLGFHASTRTRPPNKYQVKIPCWWWNPKVSPKDEDNKALARQIKQFICQQMILKPSVIEVSFFKADDRKVEPSLWRNWAKTNDWARTKRKGGK